jgi:outer membrane autotransporter protein
LGFLAAGAKPEVSAKVIGGKSQTVEGTKESAVFIGLGAGISIPVSEKVSIFVDGDTKINGDVFGYQGNAGLSYKF